MTDDRMTVMEFSAWARPACIAELGGFRPSRDPLASWFGRVSVALPGESWPTTDGAPMLPVAQINLRELPCEPPRLLSDIAMITLFLGPWELPVDELNGVNWELRAYPSVEPLVPLDEPTPARAGDPKSRKGEEGSLQPLPIRWSEGLDFPCRDCVPVDRVEAWDAWAAGRDSTELTFDGTKIGGWPYCLQGYVRWSIEDRLIADCEFAFQIGSEERTGLSWGLDGIAYVGRDPSRGPQGWFLTWQSL